MGSTSIESSLADFDRTSSRDHHLDSIPGIYFQDDGQGFIDFKKPLTFNDSPSSNVIRRNVTNAFTGRSTYAKRIKIKAAEISAKFEAISVAFIPADSQKFDIDALFALDQTRKRSMEQLVGTLERLVDQEQASALIYESDGSILFAVRAIGYSSTLDSRRTSVLWSRKMELIKTWNAASAPERSEFVEGLDVREIIADRSPDNLRELAELAIQDAERKDHVLHWKQWQNEVVGYFAGLVTRFDGNSKTARAAHDATTGVLHNSDADLVDFVAQVSNWFKVFSKLQAFAPSADDRRMVKLKNEERQQLGNLMNEFRNKGGQVLFDGKPSRISAVEGGSESIRFQLSKEGGSPVATYASVKVPPLKLKL